MGFRRKHGQHAAGTPVAASSAAESAVPSEESANAAESAPASAKSATVTKEPPLIAHRSIFSRFFPVLCVLIGIIILAYPLIATNYNNFKQQQWADKYDSDIQGSDAAHLKEMLKRAHEYNQSITGVPILDPYLTEDTSPESGPYKTYLSELNDSDIMARISVPAVGINLPIRHGTSDWVLKNGAGHLYGTALPVGGKGTRSVITSHSGMTNATLFDNLIKVKKGDIIFISVYGEHLAYKVYDIQVIKPTQVTALLPEKGKDLLTMFTCTPIGINSHRLVVTAYRIPYSPKLEKQEAAKHGWMMALQPWMWLVLLIILLGLILIGTMLRKDRKYAKAYKAQKKRLAAQAAEAAVGGGAGGAAGGDAPGAGGSSPGAEDSSASPTLPNQPN